MSDWNIRRKSRGRIRRARVRRQRQRITAASVFLLLCLSVFAVGAVTYGEKKRKLVEIAEHPNVSYSMPRIAPMLARAEAPRPDSALPELLNIQERFPEYGNSPQAEDPAASDNGDEEEEPQNETSKKNMSCSTICVQRRRNR